MTDDYMIIQTYSASDSRQKADTSVTGGRGGVGGGRPTPPTPLGYGPRLRLLFSSALYVTMVGRIAVVTF